MTSGNPGDNFYRNLPLLSEFNAIENLNAFKSAPDGWLIIIADVINSTDCVNAGRYKQVNMVGASCITAVLNSLGEIDIPYVFGGDGATMLIPGHARPRAVAALASVRQLALDEFQMRLRLGVVPVSQVRKSGVDVLVAKYLISTGNSLAMFSGGGIERADQLVRADVHCERFAVADCESPQPPDLTGLSCRWQPLESSKGQMICLLIQAMGRDTLDRHLILSDVLTRMSKILDNDMTNSNPVTERTLRFSWPPEGLKMEAILTKGRQSFFRRYIFLLYQSFIQSVLERFDLSAGNYNAAEYRKELHTNADYRRLDDTLRLVLDCTPEQIVMIAEMLAQQRSEKRIAYGIHKTDKAQMTCLVFSLARHAHIHFIDGSDGGFWAAANDYKKQLKVQMS